VNTVISGDVGAADELALARLDDDGAPPAVDLATDQPQPRPSRDPPGPHREGGRQPGTDLKHDPAHREPVVGPGPAGEAVATMIPAGDAASVRAAIPAGPPASRVSLNDARDRHGAADGRWWPRSRNALTELPGLIAALDSRPGIRVQRLSIHRDDWDEIPHRLAEGSGHVIRVDWFTTIPRHTVSVTAAGQDPITLLVISPARRKVPPGPP
jgi:Family of unknown function (DUF5994)